MKHFDTTLFQILGRLPEDATQEEISKAYRLLAQLYHPDTNPNRPDWALENMKLLNEAKEILSDPVKRKQYEKILREKLAAQEHEAAKFQSVQNQNFHLNQKVNAVQQTNKELKTVIGVAALAFILGALSD